MFKKILLTLGILALTTSAWADYLGVLTNSATRDTVAIPFNILDSVGSPTLLASGDSVYVVVYSPNGAKVFADSMAFDDASIKSYGWEDFAGRQYVYAERIATMTGTGEHDGLHTVVITVQDLTGAALTTTTMHTYYLYETATFDTRIDNLDATIASRSSHAATAIVTGGAITTTGGYGNANIVRYEGVDDVDGEIQSEAADALTAYDPPTDAEMIARTLVTASYFDPAADAVANVTTVNGLAANVITAASINAAALNGKGDWNINKTGYALTTADWNVGKTGYSLSAAGIEGIHDFRVKRVLSTGTPTTTTINATALTEADTDYWKDQIIVMLNGTADKQSARITGFTPGTDLLTFSPAMTTAPSSGDSFYIVGFYEAATASLSNNDMGAIADSVWDKAKADMFAVSEGAGDFLRDTLLAIIDTLQNLATLNDYYDVAGKRVVSTGTPTTTTINATALTEVDDYWNNQIIFFLNGNADGQSARISDFTASSDLVTFTPALTTAPASGDSFYIFSFYEAATASLSAQDKADIADSVLSHKDTAWADGTFGDQMHDQNDTNKLILAEVINIDAWNPITDGDSLIIDQSTLEDLVLASRTAIGDTSIGGDERDLVINAIRDSVNALLDTLQLWDTRIDSLEAALADASIGDKVWADGSHTTRDSIIAALDDHAIAEKVWKHIADTGWAAGTFGDSAKGWGQTAAGGTDTLNIRTMLVNNWTTANSGLGWAKMLADTIWDEDSTGHYTSPQMGFLASQTGAGSSITDADMAAIGDTVWQKIFDVTPVAGSYGDSATGWGATSAGGSDTTNILAAFAHNPHIASGFQVTWAGTVDDNAGADNASAFGIKSSGSGGADIDLTKGDDYYNDHKLLFITGNLKGTGQPILDWITSTDSIEVRTFFAAPSVNDSFIIISQYFTDLFSVYNTIITGIGPNFRDNYNGTGFDNANSTIGTATNILQISGSALAADNLEEAFDNDNTGPTMTLRSLNIVAASGSTAVNLHGSVAGAGFKTTGGITGPGAEFIGGTNSGDGLVITSNDGDGINISAGANGHGVIIVGAGTGDGMNIRSGSGATGDGMDIASAATNGDGMKLVAAGSGIDLNVPDLVDLIWDEDTTGHKTDPNMGFFITQGGAATITDADMGAIADSVWDKDTTDAFALAVGVGQFVKDSAAQTAASAGVSDADMIAIADTVWGRDTAGVQTVIAGIGRYVMDSSSQVSSGDTAIGGDERDVALAIMRDSLNAALDSLSVLAMTNLKEAFDDDNVGPVMRLSTFNVVQTVADSAAVNFDGNLLGAGFRIRGGSTADGIVIEAGNGYGIDANGVAGGMRLTATATSGGVGLVIRNTGTNGDGMTITGAGTGDGLNIRSGSGATGDGVDIASAATNGDGMKLVGTGSGKDFNATLDLDDVTGNYDKDDFANDFYQTLSDTVWNEDTTGHKTADNMGFYITQGGGISDADMGAIADSVHDKDTLDAFAIAGGFGKFVKDSTQGAAGSLDSGTVARIVGRKGWGIAAGSGSDSSTLAQRTVTVVPGNGGPILVALGTIDSSGIDTLVSGIGVQVRDLAGNPTGDIVLSNDDGYAMFNLNDGDSLTVQVHSAFQNNHIWSGDLDTIAITATAGVDTISLLKGDSVLMGDDFGVGPPSSPTLCRVFGFVRKGNDSVINRAVVEITLRERNIIDTSTNILIAPVPMRAFTDTDGYWFIDLVRTKNFNKDIPYYLDIRKGSTRYFTGKHFRVPDTSQYQVTW